MIFAKNADQKLKRPFFLLMAFTFLLSAGVLSACGNANTSRTDSVDASRGSQEPQDRLDEVTFALDYVPNTNHTGIYVAIEKGFYAEEGLEVNVVQPPDDGADALVGTGKAELGVGFQDIMAGYLGSDDPFPVTAIAAIVQHNTSGIISRAEDGITSPGKLSGKRYATWDIDVEKAIIENLVDADGASYEDVELIPANSTDEFSGLESDMFDAIWCYEGWGGQNAKLKGLDSNYFALRNFDPVFDYYTPVIIANDEFLETRPDVARAFLDATRRGYEYASEHSSEAAEILVKYAPETDWDLALASQEFLSEEYISDAPYWGYIDPDRWNAFYAWMGNEGLLKKRITGNVGFTNEFLNAE